MPNPLPTTSQILPRTCNSLQSLTSDRKLLQPIVNVVKQTIKSKTHTSAQKLLCLRLLNKCFMKCNHDFN